MEQKEDNKVMSPTLDGQAGVASSASEGQTQAGIDLPVDAEYGPVLEGSNRRRTARKSINESKRSVAWEIEMDRKPEPPDLRARLSVSNKGEFASMRSQVETMQQQMAQMSHMMMKMFSQSAGSAGLGMPGSVGYGSSSAGSAGLGMPGSAGYGSSSAGGAGLGLGGNAGMGSFSTSNAGLGASTSGAEHLGHGPGLGASTSGAEHLGHGPVLGGDAGASAHDSSFSVLGGESSEFKDLAKAMQLMAETNARWMEAQLKPKAESEEKSEEKAKDVVLIKLQDPAEKNSSIAFRDWITEVGEKMASLTSTSLSCWTSIMESVEEAYERYRTTGPLLRLEISPRINNLDKWKVLRVQIASMLREAIPTQIASELVALKQMSPEEVLFKLFKTYQPGGSMERSQLLDEIQKPAKANTVSEAVLGLRTWSRQMARIEELGIVKPDPSQLWTSLNGMVENVLNKEQQLLFKVNIQRMVMEGDVNPTYEKVDAFKKFLQAELDTLQHSRPQTASAEQQSPTKNVKRFQGPGNPSNNSNNNSPPAIPIGSTHNNHNNSNPPTNNQSNQNYTGNKKTTPCRFFEKDAGCSKGRACEFLHATLKPSDNRCFECGSSQHAKKDCPVKKGKPQEATPKPKVQATRPQTNNSNQADGNSQQQQPPVQQQQQQPQQQPSAQQQQQQPQQQQQFQTPRGASSFEQHPFLQMFTNQIAPASPSTLSQPEGEPDVKAKALIAQAMKAKEIGDLQRALMSFANSSKPSISAITIKSPSISTLNFVKKTGLIDSGA